MVGVRISLEKDYICLVLLVMSRLWCYPCVSRGGHEIHTSPSSSSYSRICFRRWPLGISSSTDLYIQPNKIPVPTHHSTHAITQLVNTHTPSQLRPNHPILSQTQIQTSTILRLKEPTVFTQVKKSAVVVLLLPAK